MLNGRLATNTERRVHGNAVELVDHIQCFKLHIKDAVITWVHHQRQAGAERVARLNHRALGCLRQPAGNGPMSCAWFERALATTGAKPLGHLHANRLRRGEVVHAFLRLGAAVLLLRGPVQRLGPVPCRQLVVLRCIALLAARSLAFVAGWVRIGFFKRTDERVFQSAGQFAHAQVLCCTGPACNRGCKRPLLPVRARVHVPHDGVAHLPGAVDATLLLDGQRGGCGLAQVDQHALVLACGVMARPACILGRLHQCHLWPGSVILKRLVPGQQVGLLLVAIDQQHAWKFITEHLNRAEKALEWRVHQCCELLLE